MGFVPGIAYCSVAFFVLVLNPAAVAAEPVAQVFIDNGELNYVGYLSREANRTLVKMYDNAAVKPAILSIRSKGGVTDAGIELGSWVHQQKLSLKVMEYCFSSCANYVFTAAKRKVVSNFAVIGYHGGLSSVTFSLDDQTEAMLAALPADARQLARAEVEQSVRDQIAAGELAEREFFSRIGVQQRITTLGQTMTVAGTDHGKAIGWTYSAVGFSKLGVGGIHVINPPWSPRFVNTDAQVSFINVP